MAYKDPNGGRLYYAKNRDIIIKRNGDYQKRNRVDTNKRNRGKYYRKAHKLTAEEYTKGIAEQNNCCASLRRRIFDT